MKSPNKKNKPGELGIYFHGAKSIRESRGVTVDLPKFTLVILTLTIQGDTTGLLDTKR